ncbi:MAG TPA: hypothetical protein VMV94_01120 [Phycisphaerae bacterium]|nr:hypothetical protein [Phycisphaerae bacterium]
MTMRRLGPASAAAVLICMAAWAIPVYGQPPGAERAARPGESPEELVQAALEKIDGGDLEQAMMLFQRARRLKPSMPKLSLVEGLLLMMNPKNPQSAAAILRLQEYNDSDEGKKDYRGFAAMGSIYKDSRTYRQAIRPLELAKKLAPAEENGKFVRANITMDLAFSYLGLDRKKEAMETAKEAVSSAPNDPKIQLGLAQVAVTPPRQETDQLGQARAGVTAEDLAVAEPAVKKAIDLLKTKIQTQPFDEDAHRMLQSCYDNLVTVKRNALKAAPDDGGIIMGLAGAMRDNGELARRFGMLTARQYALQAIDKDPKKYEWQVYTAQLEADLGAYQDAAKRLNDVLKESPDNQEAAKLLESLPSQTGAARPK